MNLADAMIGEEYIVKGIQTEDEELKSFLFYKKAKDRFVQ